MPPARFTPFELPGLLVVETDAFPDERGYFLEAFRAKDFLAQGIPPFVQDNVSRSTKGVLRGMHYQKRPKGIGKLIRCVRGAVWDAAVDIRKGSPTFGKWAALELSEENRRMLWVPEGFAHGFYTLSDVADVVYKVTDYWSQEHDRGILWSDPAVGIRWPSDGHVKLAPKDKLHPVLAEADNNFEWTGR